MPKLERGNLQAFCRTCLQRLEATSGTAPKYSIRETPNLMKLLILCTTLNINEDADEIYPQLLCAKCYETLQEFQRFRDTALKSNEMLREIVENEDGVLIAPSDINTQQGKYTIKIKSEDLEDMELVDTFKAEEPEMTSSFYVYDVEEANISNACLNNTKNNVETCDDENTVSSDAQNRSDVYFEEASTSAHATKRKSNVDGIDSEVQAKKRKDRITSVVPASILEKTNSEINSNVNILKEEFSSLKTIVAHQTLLLEKISSQLFPASKNLQIFPLKTLEEVKNVDIVTENTSDEDLINYIRSIIGTTPISKCFHLLFADEALRQINWDGRQNKFPIKSTHFFQELMFYAANGPEIGYPQFEIAMKNGFRSSKNRIYRGNFLRKQNKLT